jgi:hypothetical protein
MLPKLDVSHDSVYNVPIPFSQMYDINALRRSPLLDGVIVLDSTLTDCPFRYTIPSSFTSHQDVVANLSQTLHHWKHNCIFAQVHASHGKFGHRCMFKFYSFETPLMDEVFTRTLRFHRRFRVMTSAVRTLLPQYNTVHLRIEAESLFQYFEGSSISFDALEKCLASRMSTQLPLYISAGTSVYTYRDYWEWKQVSHFHFVNRTDLFGSTSISLGREEWGIVEALISVKSVVYAGMGWSTRSTYVFAKRRSRNLRGPVDFKWNDKCKGVIRRDSSSSETRKKILNREHEYNSRTF